MTDNQAPVTVVDNPEASRYEATDESGVVAGFAEYTRSDGVVSFTHTVVDKAFEGRGVGSALVGSALDDVRGKGERVRPMCSFVAQYVDKHPGYADLVAG